MGRCYGGVEPEEVPFHCTLSLCHRPDSLKQTLRWGLGWSLFMKAPQLWRGGGKSTRGQNETVKCVAGWTKSLSIPPLLGSPGTLLGWTETVGTLFPSFPSVIVKAMCSWAEVASHSWSKPRPSWQLEYKVLPWSGIWAWYISVFTVDMFTIACMIKAQLSISAKSFPGLDCVINLHWSQHNNNSFY